MMEKHYEHVSDLRMLFIDHKQAFDNVNRAKLGETLSEFGLPEKRIQLAQMTMNNTKAQVKIGNKLSKEFEYNKGVKQADGLSTTLFILALHKTATTVDQRGTIYNKSSQICAYADDIIARMKKTLIEVHGKLEGEAE